MIPWRVVTTPTFISVVPSLRDGVITLLITAFGGVAMYGLANHALEITDRSGLMLWNLICISTPLLMALGMGVWWTFRDKRPHLVIDHRNHIASLPRSGLEFPIHSADATFVYDLISTRNNDTACELNLLLTQGGETVVYPILHNLGRPSAYTKLGRTLQAAGLRFETRKSEQDSRRTPHY
jgi:hypothetical protein